MRALLIILLSLLAVAHSVAAEPIAAITAEADTTDFVPMEHKKNHKLLAADLVILTVGVWLPSRLLGTEWAYIGTNSVKENMKKGFVWDYDDWAMNQWGHPLHGGQFYNAARTTGYDFWGSIPFTVVGSMAWELFMEAEPPSINDLISTTFGGVYMGETQYRLSSLLLDNTSRGSERTFREIGAFFVNPIRGVNRLITGETSRYGQNPTDWHPSGITGVLSAGTNHIADGTDFGEGENAYLLKGYFGYGSPFTDHENAKPYEFFDLRFALNLHGRVPFIQEVSGNALIKGWNTYGGESRETLWGIFQHYDYLDTKSYQFGGQSLGGGMIKRMRANTSMPIIVATHLNALILGGSNIGVETASGREYNYSTGANFKAQLVFDHQKYGFLAFRYWLYWFHTISGIDGDELASYAQVTASAHIYRNWGLGLEGTSYRRQAWFDGLDHWTEHNIEARTFISYVF